MTTCHVSSHRFNYLLPSIPRDWSRRQEIVAKTMLWDMPTCEVWWECHDGVMDDQVESTERLDLCLAARNRNKKFFYVKPNLSPTCSKHFYEKIDEVKGELLTCFPWSYYDAYAHIINNRHVFRENLNGKHLVAFFGGYASCYVYDRKADVNSAKITYGDKFVEMNGLRTNNYVQELMTTYCTLQPHGVGLRHGTYEALCLGIPSLVPPSSYWKKEILDCCIQYSPGNVPNYVDLVCDDYKIRSEYCVYTWEKYMTSSAIINSVLSHV